jgi:hypothetical protein
MTLTAYPRQLPLPQTVRPWPWWRRVVALVSGWAVGFGICWAATSEHLWRWAPSASGLAGVIHDPGLAMAIAALVGGAAVIALVARGAKVDRFDLLRGAAVGARRNPASVSLQERAALFVTVGAPRVRVAVSAVSWAAFAALFAVPFRFWLLPIAVGVAAVYHLQTLAPLRIRIGPGGVRVASRLGWRLAHVPLEAVTAAGSAYLDLTSLAGPVAGRLHGHRRLLAAWVRHNGPALTLNLADGGLVVIGMPDAERAAGLIAGLAGLDHSATSPPAPWPADLLEPDTHQEAVALLVQGRKLAAVKLILERTNLSMREARRVVEAISATSR